MKKTALVVAVFLSAFVSCTHEVYPESSGVEMLFTATQAQNDSSEVDTRAVLGYNGDVLWSPSDEVSIFRGSGFGGGSKFVSQNNEPAKTVQFKGYLEGLGGLQSGQYFWAIYPYSESNSCDGQGITATLPADQTAVKGSFGLGCYPAMARTTGTSLAFYAIAGGLEFTVSRPGVRSVSIKGNNNEALAGTYKAVFGTDGKPSIQVTSAIDEVTLTAPNGSAFIPGESYVIALLPATLSKGITLTLITDDNKKGTITSSRQQTVKRAVFGRIQNLDEKVAEWQDVPATTEGGGTRTGLYLGITGFNQELYKMGIQRLDDSTKSSFDSFINSLTTKNGTLLYYSVDDAIRTLQKAQYPDDLFSASLVTFTDGLDQGSSMMIDNFPGNTVYLDNLHNRLSSSSVAGLPLTAYSVGLKGNDVSDYDMFRNNLKKLAYPESNAYEVSDMAAVNARFQEIADQISQTIRTTKYDLSISIPGQDVDAKVRFTFDGVSSATNSNLYIEGVFNLGSRSLTNVSYHGMTCSSGSTIKGVVNGIMVNFSFSDILPDNDQTISKGNVCHWTYITSSGKWQKNSEFDTDNDVNITVTRIKKTAVVLLNIDCSKSLGSQFSSLQSYARKFVQTLYNAAVDPNEVSGVSLDKTELSLYEGKTATLTATIVPSTATERSVKWSSSNTSVATVDANGTVTGVKAGTAVISATTVDGGYTAACQVNVVEQPKPEAVDLGLSVKWASWNVGALAPEEYGDYFAWGETEPKSNYYWSTYKFELGTDNNGPFSKYVTNSSYGTVDNKTVLEPEDDAAHVNWGGPWRMPTKEEQDELINNCTWTWTTQNGVYGRLVTSKTNVNSIFLPAAGGLYGPYLSNVGSYGLYWSSSIDTDYPYGAYYVDFDSGLVNCLDYYRYYGSSVRPVVDVLVTGIKLDSNSIDSIVGSTVQLSATIIPSNAKNQSIKWSNSNPSVATVDSDGLVTCISPGTTTITVTTIDGGYTASCSVSVKPMPISEAINLGLSVNWASWNVGASAPEEYGYFFAWGETWPKSNYSWSTYKFGLGTDINGTFSKYVTDSSYGTVDNKTVLEPEDDAAHVNWGGSWRMPTKEEQDELIKICTWTWTTQNGVYGRLVTSKTNGNSIFLPAAGDRYGTNLLDVGSCWSSSLYTGYPYYAYYVSFNSRFVGKDGGIRYDGFSVRPVMDVLVTGIKLDSNSIDSIVGKTLQLSATIIPSNAKNQSIKWSSSNTSVATVDANGTVTGVKTGTAIITATTVDGGYTASCQVNVVEPPKPEAVDLGLSVKWASWNIGAYAPEEYGDYFAWGETESKNDYSWSTYKFELGTDSNGPFSKYVTNSPTDSSFGTVDNKTVLEPEDDAAHVNWGGPWRMPTIEEQAELINNCTWTWTTQNGVYGSLFTSKTNGNSIFLPAAGFRDSTGLDNVGSSGGYRSSSLDTDVPGLAYGVAFSFGRVLLGSCERCDGFSVRPVTE